MFGRFDVSVDEPGGNKEKLIIVNTVESNRPDTNLPYRRSKRREIALTRQLWRKLTVFRQKEKAESHYKMLSYALFYGRELENKIYRSLVSTVLQWRWIQFSMKRNSSKLTLGNTKLFQ